LMEILLDIGGLRQKKNMKYIFKIWDLIIGLKNL